MFGKKQSIACVDEPSCTDPLHSRPGTTLRVAGRGIPAPLRLEPWAAPRRRNLACSEKKEPHIGKQRGQRRDRMQLVRAGRVLKQKEPLARSLASVDLPFSV